MGTDNINIDSSSVQCYLSILQAVVNRMAENSSSSKTWCITLVAAIIVIIADKNNPSFIWIALIPILLFCILDSYYLGLEKLFRSIYNDFIKKVHDGSVCINDLYVVQPDSRFSIFMATIKAFKSFSIWPFYSLLVIMLLFVHCVIL